MKKDRLQFTASVMSLFKFVTICTVVLLSVQNTQAMVINGSWVANTNLDEPLIIINTTGSEIYVDLNGYGISSPSNPAWSILIWNSHDVTIMNASFVNGSGIGILVASDQPTRPYNINILNMDVSGDNYGIYIDQCHDVWVYRTQAIGGQFDGITTYLSQNIVVNYCKTNDCGRHGIDDNGYDGINPDSPHGYNSYYFADTAENNGAYGFAIQFNQWVELHYCIANDNLITGFEHWWNRGRQRGCTANDNHLVGFNDCREQIPGDQYNKDSSIRNSSNGLYSGRLDYASGNWLTDYTWDWNLYW